MNKVQVLNKFKAPGNLPQGLSGVEMALWMILVEKGEKRLYGIPVLDALETGAMKSFIAVKLRDENGKAITDAEPISVACLNSGSMPNWWTYSGTIYVGFTDNKIRTYNPDMTPKIAYGTNYYYTASNLPDGLYYDGTTLYYCSAGPDAIFSINTSTGVETRQKVTVNGVDFDVISRRLALDGVNTDTTSVSYTTRKYSQDSTGLFSPTGISQNFLCSASLNKIVKRETSTGQNFINTLPSSTGPIWTNEQDTPFQVFGIAEVADYSVTEDIVIYLSGGDGNIYKVRFKDKIGLSFDVSPGFPETVTSKDGVYTSAPGVNIGREQDAEGAAVASRIRRVNYRILPPSFIEAFLVTKPSFDSYVSQWNGTSWNNVYYPFSIASTNYTICTFDLNWTSEQRFNNPVLSTQLWTSSYDGTGLAQEYSPTVKVQDITTIIPTTTFFFTGRYGNESQSTPVAPIPSPIPVGHIRTAIIRNANSIEAFKFLTDNGSLTVLDQFTGKSNQRGIHIGYKIPYIKIAGQTKDGYLKKSGTTYTAAVASTPVVTINEGSAVKYVGTRLTGGNYEIYRSYLSFDTEFIDFQPGVVHLYLKTVSVTTQDMELLVYEMPAHNTLTADKWGSVGRLLATKHICAYHSIYLPLDVDLTNGLYVEIRGSQEATNSYIQNDLVTITAYELRIFS